MELTEARRYQLATGLLATLAALVVGVIATQVFPYHSLNHDEGVYLQQAAMLLEGQLYLRPPVDGAFRPWFFVEADEGLYPKYSPVPAAMFAIGKLLGGFRVALVLVAAGNVALVVGVVREAFDRPTGLLAGAFVLASPLFLIDSSIFLPYAPTTLLNLGFGYAYLRAHRTDGRRWATVAGAAVGLAFFSRPYTAVLFATPFIVHACWTLVDDWRAALPRQGRTAALGSAGVAVTLLYNAVVTGSPLVFPYQVFAPEDGLGFGHRQILAHEAIYSPELALRANRIVLELFFTEWIAGGLLGVALAVVGLALTAVSRFDPRRAILAGMFVTIPAGNVYFWGNFNILGVVGREGDGLVASFGPYYHFDLLVPTAAFAAYGAWRLGQGLWDVLDSRVDRRAARVALAAVLVLAAVPFVTVTDSDLNHRIEENMAATETYERAYEPFEGGAPANSLVLVPDPYGDWLNHPFQPLRNDPGYDGRAVYGIDDEPFEVIDAFPDRRTYRYVYRGAWAPYAGSPEAARLQRVQDVRGDSVHLSTTVGVPGGADSVTARVAADEQSAYYVVPNASVADDVSVNLTIEDGRVRAASGLRALDDEMLTVDDRETVTLTVFVDYSAGGGFTYRFDLPVDRVDGEVRALTPRIERCVNARACGGSAAFVPENASGGVFARTNLTSGERNP
jgi:hypothetical protein